MSDRGIAFEPSPAYATFYEYLIENQPLLISSAYCESWSLFSTWFTDAGAIDYVSLSTRYGDMVHMIDDETAAREWKLKDVFALWSSGTGRSLYLKDWHLPLRLLESCDSVDKELYRVEETLKDDWMNSFYTDIMKNDFRFVYLGGGDTYTGLHRDVYDSYSISTNLYGSKRWTLFPPSLTPLLLPLIQEAQYKDRSVDVREWSEEMTKEFTEKGMIEVVQAERETIFIPSGWFHQVGSPATLFSYQDSMPIL